MLSHNFQIRSRCPTSSQTLVSALHNHFLSTAVGNVETWVHRNSLSKTKKLGLRRASTFVKPVLATTKKSTTVKAVVTMLPTVSLLVELVAAKLDAGYIKTYYDYEATFEIPKEFGEVGGVKSIVLEGFTTGPIHLHCDSWIHPKSVNPEKRLFFCNKMHPALAEMQAKMKQDREDMDVRLAAEETARENMNAQLATEQKARHELLLNEISSLKEMFQQHQLHIQRLINEKDTPEDG